MTSHREKAEQILEGLHDVHPSMVPAYAAEASAHAILAVVEQLEGETPTAPLPAQRAQS